MPSFLAECNLRKKTCGGVSSTVSLSQWGQSVIRAVVFCKHNLTISYTQMKIHQEDQTEIIERVMDIKICNSEWCDQAGKILSRKTNMVQKLLRIVSTVHDESL